MEQSAWNSATNSAVPLGRIDLWGRDPATLWLANFRLSLRDEGTPRREQLELPEPAQKFGGEEGIRHLGFQFIKGEFVEASGFVTFSELFALGK